MAFFMQLPIRRKSLYLAAFRRIFTPSVFMHFYAAFCTFMQHYAGKKWRVFFVLQPIIFSF
jgi:hypothetical protein